jgi:hypothetical protein
MTAAATYSVPKKSTTSAVTPTSGELALAFMKSTPSILTTLTPSGGKGFRT